MVAQYKRSGNALNGDWKPADMAQHARHRSKSRFGSDIQRVVGSLEEALRFACMQQLDTAAV